MSRCLFHVCVLIAVLPFRAAAADEPLQEENKKRVEWLTETVFRHGTAIVRGEFQGTSHHFILTDKGDRKEEFKSKFRVSFDTIKESTRFDFTTTEGGDTDIRYVVRPGASYLYSPQTKFMSYNPPVTSDRDHPSCYFNIRLFGIAISEPELLGQLPGLRAVWDRMPATISSPDDQDDSRTKTVVRTTHRGMVESRLVFNVEEKLTLARSEIRYAKNGQFKPDWNSYTQLKWKEVSGLMVPAHAMIKTRLKGTGVRVNEYKIKWQSVNQPVDDSLFSPSSFNLVAGTRVVNNLEDKPVIIKEVGR